MKARLAVLVLVLGSAGCVYTGSFCEIYGCDGTGGTSSTSGSTSTTSTATMSTSSATSTSTGTTPGCAPTLTDGPKDDTCGVYVDPINGDDTKAGTMAAPLKTLGAASAAWIAGKAIYACDGELTDTNGVSLPSGVVVYGGLDCGKGFRLKSANARTSLHPAPGTIALSLLAGPDKTELHQLKVQGDASASAGASAIGVVVDEVEANFDGVDIIAGDAVAGAASQTPTDNIGPISDPTDISIKGNGGNNANTTTPTTPNPGGVAKTNALCVSTGGKGGDGGEIAGTPQQGAFGNDGSPLPVPNPSNYGLGGKGENASQCAPGSAGENGDPVTDGPGAAGSTSLGTIALDGFHGVAGGAGPDGNAGQGGGGGGGAKGKVSPDTRGASGGGGGAGGCGGKGAQGGGPGGASIALVLLGSTAPALMNVTLTAGKGGDGGAGAAGESGGIGGDGGARGLGVGAPPTTSACIGGAGGSGSSGGAGGGGRGGHSLGIAYVTALPAAGFTVTHATGGAAGTTAGTGAPADPGLAQDSAALGAN